MYKIICTLIYLNILEQIKDNGKNYYFEKLIKMKIIEAANIPNKNHKSLSVTAIMQLQIRVINFGFSSDS